MRKLQENEMENLMGGELSCLSTIVSGAGLGFIFGGMGAFVGAMIAASTPACTGIR